MCTWKKGLARLPHRRKQSNVEINNSGGTSQGFTLVHNLAYRVTHIFPFSWEYPPEVLRGSWAGIFQPRQLYTGRLDLPHRTFCRCLYLLLPADERTKCPSAMPLLCILFPFAFPLHQQPRSCFCARLSSYRVRRKRLRERRRQGWRGISSHGETVAEPGLLGSGQEEESTLCKRTTAPHSSQQQ